MPRDRRTPTLGSVLACLALLAAGAAPAEAAPRGGDATRADRASVGPPRVDVSLRAPMPATTAGRRYVVTARVRPVRRGAAGARIVAGVRERRADGTLAGRWVRAVPMRGRPVVVRVVTGAAEGGGRLRVRVRVRAGRLLRGVVAAAIVGVRRLPRPAPAPAAPVAPPPAAPPRAVPPPPPVALRAGPPAAGGYFRLLPVGAALPSEAECAGRLSRSSWEPRPENREANRTTPGPLGLPDHPDFDGRWNATYRPRITGSFVGTTDEIIQWAACKWGLDDEVMRAQAAAESDWRQSAEGDLERREDGLCAPGDGRDPCPTSFGMLQNKWFYNPGTYPMLRAMTAFHLDFSAAKLRGCYDGRRDHPAGDIWACYAQWWSGSWSSAAGDAYVGRLRGELSARRWAAWPDQSALGR